VEEYEYRRRSKPARHAKSAPPKRASKTERAPRAVSRGRSSRAKSDTVHFEGLSTPAGSRAARAARHGGPGARVRSDSAIFASRRSRHAPVGAMLIALLVVAAAVGIAAFFLTRPASVRIVATPTDALVTFAGSEVASQTANGTLEVKDLKAGGYSVIVERTGFASVETSVTLKRGRREKLEYTLQPLPQAVSIATHPKGAAVTITSVGGSAYSGTTPFAEEIPSGQVTLSITLDGYNTYESEFFLDTPTTLDLYLDPEGQILHGIGTITTKGAPKGVSVTHDGSEAWTSILNGPPSIQIFNPRTGASIGEVDIGEHGAVEVIFNKAGTLAYTSQMETAKCFEIDVKTRKVVREFDTKSAWTKWVQLSPDEKTLYASNWSGDDVSEIDLATGTLARRVRVSNTPRGMYATADGKYLYVGGFDSGYLDRIDLATGKSTSIFKDGGALRHIVGDEATGRLFISDMSKDLIWVHDIAAGTTKKFVDVDEKPNTIDLTPDGKMLFVSCRGENNPKSYYIPGPEWGSILVFDTSNGKPLDALIAGNQPTALDVSDDGKLLIFSDFLDNRLRVYEIPDYETFSKGKGGRFDAHFAEIKK
jgi:DNA-binding beta-propeller fold protein YncE